MGFFRSLFISIDKVVYSFVDNAYNLVLSISSITLNNDVVEQIIKNLYVLVGIFAFFRIALLLVNAIIDPDKLNEKGKGLANILSRTLIMLVLLVLLPTLFNLAYEFQFDVLGIKKDSETGEIMHSESGNIIEKLILGESISNQNNDENTSPGDNFKTIALTALITVDDNFTEAGLQVPSKDNEWKGGYKANENCKSSMCNTAIRRWNRMYINGKMDIDTLSNYINVNEKIEIKDNETGEEKQKVYVYNYSIVITTIVGAFIVYVLLSFALDIGMRVFQLAALEIIAPIFVTTFIDPKSASSGMFSRWLKEVGSTYAGLFIRVACISLLVLFTSLLNQIKFIPIEGNSVWVKLALMLGLLMFAKKAPKWISDLLGLKSEGLGIGIGKKISEGALGGALLAKGAKGLTGVGATGLRNLHYANKQRRNMNKKARKEHPELSDYTARRAYRKSLADQNMSGLQKDALRDEYMKNRKAGMKPADARDAAKATINDNDYQKQLQKLANQNANKQIKDKMNDANIGARANAARVASALIDATGAFKGAANADKLSGSLKLAKDQSEHFRQISGIQGKTVGEKFSKWISTRKEAINTTAFGDANAIANRADLLKKENFIKDNYNKAALNNIKAEIPDFDYTKLVNGKGRGLQYSYTDEGDYIANFDHYLRSLVANASGYKVHYEKSADGKIITDSNGIPKIYYTGKDGSRLSDDMALKIRENAKHITSNEGTAKLQEIFNIKSANLLDDYGRNLSNISDTTQVINNIRDSISKVADSFTSKIKGLSSDISGVISGSIGNLKIDFNSLGLSEDLKNKFKAIQGDGPLTSANLSMIISEIERNPALASSGLAEKFENLKTIALDNDEYNNYNRLLSSKNEELSEYLRRQDLMDPAYNAVGYKMADEGRILFEGEGLEKQLADVRSISHAERERKQQSQQGRIEDQVKLFEKKKEEKK